MMNKEQLEAIKERVASMKQQARTDVTADISAIEIAFQDVPALIAEVERLRGVISEALEASEKLGCSIERELAEKEQLREALKFYADGQKYTLAYDSNLVGTVEIFKDNGKKARQALGDSDE